jgi:hypothetical protein
MFFFLFFSSDAGDNDSAQSPLEYQGVLKFPATKSQPAAKRKRVRLVQEPAQSAVASTEKFKVTGLERVKVGGERVKARVSPMFDMEEMQSIKVQVSSTTPQPKAKRKSTLPVQDDDDDIAIVPTKKSKLFILCEYPSRV